MLRQELELGYLKWVNKPGNDLGVFDNASEFEECKRRVHCNSTHGDIMPELVYNEKDKKYELDKSKLKELLEDFNSMEKGRKRTIIMAGDHNNVYFPYFREYKKTLPEALMQKIDGSYLELYDELIHGGEGIPMPAIDDPTLTSLYMEALSEQAKLLKTSQYVIGYVLGFEMLYPEYFNLGQGDFRPASWEHFSQWCKKNNIEAPSAKEDVLSKEITYDWMKWYSFREQAMADRCANYYQAVLNEDVNHLIYYPTHGSTLSDKRRMQLGQQPATLAAACDGMEMGHIMIENDVERRNVVMTSHYTSFGAPVIIPRLGNKQVDLGAIGGGRSFTPATLRRFVYESLGLGIEKIFPIHWSNRLHDGEWCIKDTEAEKTCLEVFDEITKASPYLYGMARLQPQVGLLASDATWIEEWNLRWTALIQDAFSNHASMTIISDAIINKYLVAKMPVIVIIDNHRIEKNTLDKLVEYLGEGGKVIILGQFARETEEILSTNDELLKKVLSHKNVYYDDEPKEEGDRVIRELFLYGPEYGIGGQRFEFTSLAYNEVEKIIKKHAPDTLLKPAILKSDDNLEDVNVYALTDRSSLLYVLINNSTETVNFNFSPNSKLISDYFMKDVLLDVDIDGEVQLLGNATKIIWVYEKINLEDIEKQVLKAEKAFEGWLELGADVSAIRFGYSNIVTGPHLEKRHALSKTIINSLVIKANCIKTEDGIQLRAKIFNSNQESVSGARCTFRITPGTFKRYEFIENEDEYVCNINDKDLPTYYDVNLQKYLTVKGMVRFVISAETKEQQGGCVMSAEI